MSTFSHERRQAALAPPAPVPSRPPAAVRQRAKASGDAHAMEPSSAERLGFDFSSVRIRPEERDATSANALHASAFTVSPHIAFTNGQYAPGSEAGRHLLAHELSHVVRQPPGSPMPVGPLPAPGTAKAPPPSREAVAERQGRNAYPKNPRAAVLQAKMILGTITKDETSELRGIASFPDNPRAAMLYAKQDAGTIKPAEQEELRGYFQRQATRDRALHKDPGLFASQGGESPRAAALRAKQAKGSLSREEQAELQGLNGYPDNPRAAALHAKQLLGPLSREERAELQGFNAYPNNRRAAALHAKQVLGTLSPGEQAELQGFIAHPHNLRAAALHTKQVLGPLSLQERAELQGFNAYPNNPRAAALYAKQVLGPLSREERAELQGINAYPRHPRAAALYAKKVLGTITWQEQNELSDEEWYRAMGEFLIRLERKAREGRLWPEQRDTYERLRVNPKVRQRAHEILEAGGPPHSFDD
jgi:hypothetical protein